MEKTEVKHLDFNRKLSVVFSAQMLNMENDTSITQRLIEKKKLNIPICDVHSDRDYEKIITANYIIPSSYVKHCKKIGDEIDVSIDYIMDSADKQWLTNQIRSESGGKEVQKMMTFEAFEGIINILERYTAFSKEPIPMIHAQKLVFEQLNWDPTSQNVMSSVCELYRYWLQKREKYNKPLCRRYWPQVPSSDTNPHQVFRTRDKERYKLRKQQKRNDVDSFRKMQQLRKDFSKAKVLLELVLERETLREADYEVQREMFEQRVFDLQNIDLSGDNNDRKLRKVSPYRHTLQFTHIDPNEITEPATSSSSNDAVAATTSAYMSLLASSDDNSNDFMDVSPQSKKGGSCLGSYTPSGATVNASIKKSSSLIDLTSGNNKKSSMHKTNTLSSVLASDGRKGLSSSMSAAAAASGAAVFNKSVVDKKGTSDKKKKRDRDSSASSNSRMVMYTVSNGQTVELGTGAVHTASSLTTANASSGVSTGARPFAGSGVDVITVPSSTVNGSSSNGVNAHGSSGVQSVDELRLIHPNLDGPEGLCQPMWPTFMAPLGIKDLVVTSSQRSYSDYMDDLELRRDPVTNKAIAPDKYRCRCRVGRGGRIVMDRVPVYATPKIDHDNWSSTSSMMANDATLQHRQKEEDRNTTYIYPTSTRHHQLNSVLQHTSASHTSSHSKPVATVGNVPPSSSSGHGGLMVASTPDSHVSSQRYSPGTVASCGGIFQHGYASRQLPEIPISNKKIVKYNVKVKTTNQQMLANDKSGSNGSQIVFHQRIPVDLPCFVPPAMLNVPVSSRQRLREICAESDSEDERVELPKTLWSNCDLDKMANGNAKSAASSIVNGPLQPAASEGSTSSDSNVKYSIRV